MGPGGPARAHVDDAATAPAGHDARRRLRHDEVPGEVHVDDASPPRLVGLEEVQHRTGEAGVVDQHVDPAVGGHDGVDHGVHLRAVGNVGGGGHGGATRIADRLDDLVDRAGVDVVDRHLRSDAGEPLGDGPADASSGTGHDDDLAGNDSCT